MNRLEAQYAQYLELQKQAGEILHFEYESHKLRLGKSSFYTPDFLVITPERYIEFHEVKGFMRDDAAVKIRVAAAKFTYYTFLLVKQRAKKRGGGWEIRRY